MTSNCHRTNLFELRSLSLRWFWWLDNSIFVVGCVIDRIFSKIGPGLIFYAKYKYFAPENPERCLERGSPRTKILRSERSTIWASRSWHTPGFNPIKNIFSSENFSVKSQKILKPQIFSVKQKNFLCRFFGAASWGRFLKIFTEIFDRNTTWKICRNFLKTENLARKQKKIMLIGFAAWLISLDK